MCMHQVVRARRARRERRARQARTAPTPTRLRTSPIRLGVGAAHPAPRSSPCPQSCCVRIRCFFVRFVFRTHRLGSGQLRLLSVVYGVGSTGAPARHYGGLVCCLVLLNRRWGGSRVPCRRRQADSELKKLECNLKSRSHGSACCLVLIAPMRMLYRLVAFSAPRVLVRKLTCVCTTRQAGTVARCKL